MLLKYYTKITLPYYNDTETEKSKAKVFSNYDVQQLIKLPKRL